MSTCHCLWCDLSTCLFSLTCLHVFFYDAACLHVDVYVTCAHIHFPWGTCLSMYQVVFVIVQAYLSCHMLNVLCSSPGCPSNFSISMFRLMSSFGSPVSTYHQSAAVIKQSANSQSLSTSFPYIYLPVCQFCALHVIWQSQAGYVHVLKHYFSSSISLVVDYL